MENKVTNSLDIKKLKYEPLKPHKRKTSGKSVYLISRAAYRKLTANRFTRKLRNWSHLIYRNITRVGRKTLERK